MKNYSDLVKLKTFEERYEYLKMKQHVGEETFGVKRYLNQVFYRSKEWKTFRNKIIIRDNGCDLGIDGRDIMGAIYIHHITPITVNDVSKLSAAILLNPENAICCSFNTHQAIHYSDSELLVTDYVERTPYDTCPWRK